MGSEIRGPVRGASPGRAAAGRCGQHEGAARNGGQPRRTSPQRSRWTPRLRQQWSPRSRCAALPLNELL